MLDLHFGTPPRLSIASTNLNSASAYPSSRGQRKRARMILRLLAQLLSKFDIVCVQETHLATDEKHYLNRFPSHTVFYNNKSRGIAGVAIFVKKSLLRDYQVRNHALGEAAVGRIQVLGFEPNSAPAGVAPLRPFYVTNLYLSSGESNNAKTEEIGCLGQLEAGLMFMTGDFNFTEEEEDGGALLGGRAKKAWADLVERWRLREVYQEVHTFHRGLYSSRLDRFYTNLTDTDRLLAKPVAYVPCLDYAASDRFSAHISAEKRRRNLLPDHLPIGLKFVQGQEEFRARDYNCPKWVAQDPDFIALARANLDFTDISDCPRAPYLRMLRWKDAIRKATSTFFKSRANRQKRFDHEAAELCRAKKLLVLIRARKQIGARIKKLLTRAPYLRDFITWERGASRWVDTSLTARIEVLLHTLGLPGSSGEGEVQDFKEAPQELTTRRQHNVLQNLSRCLPSDRARLVGMRPEVGADPVFEAQAIGDIIKKHWTPIWRDRSAELQPASVFLDQIDYRKKIKEELAPQHSTLDDYLEIIRSTNDSCAGPDGIPFSVYRSLIDVVAPLLLGVEMALGEGVPPPTRGGLQLRAALPDPEGRHDGGARPQAHLRH